MGVVCAYSLRGSGIDKRTLFSQPCFAMMLSVRGSYLSQADLPIERKEWLKRTKRSSVVLMQWERNSHPSGPLWRMKNPQVV